MSNMPPFTATPPAALRAPPAKPWWRSKTLWFNLLCTLAAAAEAGMGLLQPALPVNAYAVLVFTLVVGNAGLRFVTTQALAGRTQSGGT